MLEFRIALRHSDPRRRSRKAASTGRQRTAGDHYMKERRKALGGYPARREVPEDRPQGAAAGVLQAESTG